MIERMICPVQCNDSHILYAGGGDYVLVNQRHMYSSDGRPRSPGVFVSVCGLSVEQSIMLNYN